MPLRFKFLNERSSPMKLAGCNSKLLSCNFNVANLFSFEKDP